MTPLAPDPRQPRQPRQPHRPSVLIVDPDRRVRQSLAGLIALTDGLRLGGTAAGPGDALALLAADRVDVLIVDLRLPTDGDGLAFVDEVRRRWPGVAIMVMSCDEDLALSSMEHGAVAFVAKSGQPEAIVDLLLGRGAPAGPAPV
jgi:DNA-binding NarL/FixJ family response regulator